MHSLFIHFINENEIESDKDNESVKDNEDNLMESFQVFTQSNNPCMEITHPSSSTQRYPSQQCKEEGM